MNREGEDRKPRSLVSGSRYSLVRGVTSQFISSLEVILVLCMRSFKSRQWKMGVENQPKRLRHEYFML